LKAYFAHPYESEVKGAAKIVLHLLQTALPDWQFLNPFDSDLTEVWLKDPENITTAKAIMCKDLKLICQSDIVVAYLPDVPMAPRGVIGTPMEIFYSVYCSNTAVYCLTPFHHPWLMALDVYCTDDIDALIKKLEELKE